MGVRVIGQQNADIADTLQLRDVAMANIFWLSIFAVQMGATRPIRPCAVAMRPYVKLLLTACYYGRPM